jgi:hypothetical protein
MDGKRTPYLWFPREISPIFRLFRFYLLPRGIFPPVRPVIAPGTARIDHIAALPYHKGPQRVPESQTTNTAHNTLQGIVATWYGYTQFNVLINISDTISVKLDLRYRD